MSKGILLIVSGLSGAGKGTICKRLIEKYPDFELSVSMTSRAPRAGEEHGREYFFVSTEEFEQSIANDLLLEHAHYVDHYYGTPRKWVAERMAAGKNVILEIDLQGAFQVRDKIQDTALVFIMPPSMEELERRLRKRGSETEEEIQKRLARAKEEVAFVDRYDYVIVNEEVEKSVDMLYDICYREKQKIGD